MNSGDWNVIAGHAADCAWIIAGGDDSLVFIRRVDEQPREFDVGPAFQRCRRFGAKIDIHRRERQFAFGTGKNNIGTECHSHFL